MKEFLLKQHSLGPWLGGFKAIFNSTTGYIGWVNFAMLAAMAYYTTFGEPIKQYAPWMSFAMFVAFVLLAILLGMVLEYKIIIPSHQEYSNIQRYKHKDPLARDIREMEAKLSAKLEKQFKELKGSLEALRSESGAGDSPK